MIPWWRLWVLLLQVYDNVHSLTVKTCHPPLDRFEARTLLNDQLLPTCSYAKRSLLSRKDVLQGDESPMTARDPRLSFTYGEFPLSSLDQLLDAAVPHLPQQCDNNSDTTPLTIVDIGSGCGRLCLYMALTRPRWNVHGIEASSALYQEALHVHKSAVEQGYVTYLSSPISAHEQTSSFYSTLSFHEGLAEDFGSSILQHADILFCYSTAFESSGIFDPSVGGMILGGPWNDLFLQHAKPNALVITTDRALDPSRGWNLLEHIDNVSNREVLDSTCFIQQRVS